MALSGSQKKFLRDLYEHDGERELRAGAEELPGIKALVDGGFITLPRALSGPLAVPTGTYFAKLTEAGRIAIRAIDPVLAEAET